MISFPIVKLLDNEPLAGVEVTSQPIDARKFNHFSIHAKWQDTSGAQLLKGLLHLEVSTLGDVWEIYSSVDVTDVDLFGAGYTGSQMWLDRDYPYPFIRLRFVPDPANLLGTGTLNATYAMKGDR